MKKRLKLAVVGDILAGYYLSRFLEGKDVDTDKEDVGLNSFFIRNGIEPIPPSTYVWGDVLPVLKQADLRTANLEASLATSTSKKWQGKQWCFRISPEAASPALQKGQFHYLSLANNHVFDYHEVGMMQTKTLLDSLGIAFSGAGKNESEAFFPAVHHTKAGKIGIYSFATNDCHLSGNRDKDGKDLMGATENRPGIFLLHDLSDEGIATLCRSLLSERKRRQLDFTFVFMHWGSNYPEPRESPPFPWYPPSWQRNLAYRLIDTANIDGIFGTSSHHIHGIEIHNQKPILYGTGDFLSDYYISPDQYDIPQYYRNRVNYPEKGRSSAFMSFAYLFDLSKENGIEKLTLFPTRCRKLQVQRILAGDEDFEGHIRCMQQLSEALGTTFEIENGTLVNHLIKLSPQSAF